MRTGGATHTVESETEVQPMAGDHDLDYDWQGSPALRWGYNDLNGDGIPDTLLTIWNGKTVAFVSDDGKLPWPEVREDRDWHQYFNEAFNVGQEPPTTWNEARGDWGSYTILVDRDGCGRFDGPGDFYYRALDLNGDGYPEAEYYHLYPGRSDRPWSNKLHFSLNGERELSYLDWESFSYTDNEQRYLDDGKYVMNVHGSGFFLNSYCSEVQHAWENPIAWYDFDFDGYTNMVVRAADTHLVERRENDQCYRGDLSEFEIAFELNGNTGPGKAHSLDMQLTFYQYEGTGPSYRGFVDRVPGLAGLPEAAFLSERRLSTRHEQTRRYFPYMDGHKFAAEYQDWAGVWLIFDEDDDDNRWEEMFSRHEPAGEWEKYSDRIGDRTEVDSDFGGRGQLYVGRFDGRIHLYHAECCIWDVDYLGLYKGCVDRTDTAEGPEPPSGLVYPRVRYSDTNGNGFIDRLEFVTAAYGSESHTEEVTRTILLSDYAEDGSSPDVCDLVSMRTDAAQVSGWRVEDWDGRPLAPEDFRGTPNKEIFDRMTALYESVCNDMWDSAWQLYTTAKRHGLNVSEGRDRDTRTEYTREELANLRSIEVPAGYSRHLTGTTRRERYHNGFWLREKVFADVLEHSGLDRLLLEGYYYTGDFDTLCRYIEDPKR